MRALALFVAALIVSFLSLGNEISLTTYFSTANSFRLRRREYLTAGQSAGPTLEQKTPARAGTHVCRRSAIRLFLTSIRLEISAPAPRQLLLVREFVGAWLSVDPPPTPPPIFAAAA